MIRSTHVAGSFACDKDKKEDKEEEEMMDEKMTYGSVYACARQSQMEARYSQISR